MADDNTTQEFDFLGKTKILLGIADDSQDNILQVYIDLTKQSICNYCNVDELPSALYFTSCVMCANTYRETNAKNNVGKVVGNVTSVSEGGRTVGFGGVADFKSSLEDKIACTAELNKYKKLYKL